MPARREKAQAVQVDVLVGARRAVDMIVTRRELGRVEDDEVEGFPGIAKRAQVLEHVGADELRALFFKAVARGVRGRHVERFLRRVDRNDFRSAALQKRQGEAARVAEAVQRAKPAAVAAAEVFGQLLRRQAALALVDVKARLVPDADVNAVAHAVLHHLDRLGRLFAAEVLRADLQPLAAAGRRIRAVEDAARAGDLHQKVGDQFAVGFRPRRLELGDEEVPVLVDDETGEAVGFAEDEAKRRRAFAERFARFNGVADLLFKPRGVDHVAFAEAPAAHAQGGLG